MLSPSAPHKQRPGGAGAYSSVPSELDIPVQAAPRPAAPPRQEPPAATGGGGRRPWLPQKKRTRGAVWCGAAVCLAFSLLLIVAGVVTLVVFLAIKPRHPHFDAPGATINSIYVDSPAYLNADFSLLANFSNPNRRMDVRFEVVTLELYFRDTLVATRALQPFSQRRGEVRLESVHMVSSEVYLSPELVGEMQREVAADRVTFRIRGTFKVRGSLLGLVRFTYWLYGRCTVQLTRPPGGVLVAKTCRTSK